MAKVTIHETPKTPSEQVIRSANDIHRVTDAKGRVLGLREPQLLDQARAASAVGAENAGNQAYMGIVTPLLYIVEIDGESLPFPANHRQVEALIQRAGNEGLVATMLAIKGHFSQGGNAELESQIKNLLGTPD